MSLHHTSDPECPLCLDKISKATPVLQDWFKIHVKPNFPRAHISWSYRNETEQEQAFADHKSKLRYPYSAHNKIPALALDIFEIDENGEGLWAPTFFYRGEQVQPRQSRQPQVGGLLQPLGRQRSLAGDPRMKLTGVMNNEAKWQLR